MEQVKLNTPNPVAQEDDQVKALMILMQSMFETSIEEITKSKALREVNISDELALHLEKMVNKPLTSMITLFSRFEDDMKSMIESLVVTFLKSKSKLIKGAYRTKTEVNDLHFCVVLKKDNLNNRIKIFDFYNQYDHLKIANTFPVYFQFVPEQAEDKIEFAHKIALA